MKEALVSWLDNNHITYRFENDRFLEINGEIYYHFYPNPQDNKVLRLQDDSLVFNIDDLHPSDDDLTQLTDNTKIIFQVGQLFFYTDNIHNCNNFKDLKYIGSYSSSYEDINFPHLGCHTHYELLNSCVKAKDYVSKARFLNTKTLAIIDRNTLAGTLDFQLTCQKNKIKPIIGYTANVQYDNEYTFDIILYVCDEIGWKNLLTINSFINVHNEGFISSSDLLKHSAGLIVVFNKKSILYSSLFNEKKLSGLIKIYQAKFEDCFFAIDSVEYQVDTQDIRHLQYIKRYIETFSSFLKPILINESYYVDQHQYKSYQLIAQLAKRSIEQSSNQYFKSIDEAVDILTPLCKSKRANNILLTSIENAISLGEYIEFSIDISTHKLPNYESEFEDISNRDLFLELLELGMEKKIYINVDPSKHSLYRDRLDKELSVILKAGFDDYFLILWDIINWCKRKNILTGPGRGSAAGSLISYLLDITQVDPIEYDLLFERFLNESRISGENAKSPDALPDIDVDFQEDRRHEVQQYIRDKYGEAYVCNIGTYGTMKLKSALTDFGKLKGAEHAYMLSLSKAIDDQPDYRYEEIFKYALKNRELYKYIQQKGELIEQLKPILNNVKTPSIHAAAIVIVPKSDHNNNPRNIYEWLPVKKVQDRHSDHSIIVSQWEHTFMATAGFLKEDVLGLSQLTKFQFTLDLIKKNRNKTLKLNSIPLEDRRTFNLFQKGLNEDVFQFGTFGLKRFSKQVKPSRIEELIAMVALFRPGPMESNAHNDYIAIKNGKKRPKFDFKLQEVTQNTFGLYIYQEQIMRAANVLANFSLVEADSLRKAMGKKIPEIMAQFREKFVVNSIENGCSKEEAELIWNKLEVFSGYGFNKSHATAYAVLGYWSQYLKAHYPLEFWTTSLNFASDAELQEGFNQLQARLDELYTLDIGVELVPVDINYSDKYFTCDRDTNKIYWSFSKVAYLGSSSIEHILLDRNKHGKYYDFEEFLSRVPKSKINKRQVHNLIISGAFDSLCYVKETKDRMNIVKFFNEEYLKQEIPEQFIKLQSNNDWILLQKEVCGYGNIDFRKILIDQYMRKYYKTPNQIQAAKEQELVCVGGYVLTKSIKSYRGKDKEYVRIVLTHNDQNICLMIWHEFYHSHYELIESLEKNNLIFFLGRVRYDSYNDINVIYSDKDSRITKYE